MRMQLLMTDPTNVERKLTEAEERLLLMMAAGESEIRISEETGVKAGELSNLATAVLMKIGAPNQLQAALWAAKNLADA